MPNFILDENRGKFNKII